MEIPSELIFKHTQRKVLDKLEILLKNSKQDSENKQPKNSKQENKHFSQCLMLSFGLVSPFYYIIMTILCKVITITFKTNIRMQKMSVYRKYNECIAGLKKIKSVNHSLPLHPDSLHCLTPLHSLPHYHCQLFQCWHLIRHLSLSGGLRYGHCCLHFHLVLVQCQ